MRTAQTISSSLLSLISPASTSDFATSASICADWSKVIALTSGGAGKLHR